jgi:hypothetical protein
VVAGDGQFLAVGEPRRWLKGNAPPLPGELFWLGGERAVYLGTDRLLRQTADGGRRWEPVRWQPPGSAVAAAGSAVQGGREVWIELPEGDRRSPLLAVWNDQRDAGAPRLIFTRRGVAGDWRVLADTAQGLLTEGGERLPYNHLLRLGDRLVLVTGCVRRAAGAALVVRILADGPLGGPRLVAVKTVDAEEPAHP